MLGVDHVMGIELYGRLGNSGLMKNVVYRKDISFVL